MIDFIDMFPTEEACLHYLSVVRWPDGYDCAQCKGSDYWKKAKGVFLCRSCGYEGSVTRGTLFHDSHKPLRLWFQAIWYIVNQKNGISALGLQKALGFGSYHTAWEWLHKLRRAMVRPNRDRLSGLVEVDETFMGGRHYGKRGRGAAGKNLVFIAVEDKDNTIGRIRLKVIKDATSTSLLKAISHTIEPGSSVRSDGWKGYAPLSEHGYIHMPVIHENAETGDATGLAHQVISLLKRWWLGTHQGAIHAKHLEYYLDEFTFRFNRRNSRSRGMLFYRLIEQALQIEPIPAKMFIHNM